VNRSQRIACVALLATFGVPSFAPAATAPTREALIARWTAANAHKPGFAALKRRFDAGQAGTLPPAGLTKIAAAEYSVPGRYQLQPQRAAATDVSEPWWERAYDWVRDQLSGLWKRLFSSARLGRGGALAIGDLLTIAAIVAAAWALYRLVRGLNLARRPRTATTPLGPDAGASELHARARACAQRGEYAAAARLLFAAAIVLLDRSGVVTDDRAATVGDLRRRLRSGAPSLEPDFNEVAAAFVAGAYAERALAASDWERAQAGYSALAQRAQT